MRERIHFSAEHVTVEMHRTPYNGHLYNGHRFVHLIPLLKIYKKRKNPCSDDPRLSQKQIEEKKKN